MKFRQLLAGTTLFCALVAAVRAQTFTWIPNGPNALFSNGANWVGGAVPPNNGTAVLQFPIAYENVTLPAGPLNFSALQFGASSGAPSYFFGTPSSTIFTVQGGGISKFGGTPTQYAGATFGPGIALDLAANQTWTINHAIIQGSIGGAGKLTFQPTAPLPDISYGVGSRKGTLDLQGPGNFTGGLEVQDTQLILSHSSALSSGSVKLTNSDIHAHVSSIITIPLTLSGTVGFFQSYEMPTTISVTGQTTLDGNTNLYVAVPLVLSGKIINAVGKGAAQLGVQGRVQISGDNSTGAYTGGTRVFDGGVVIFTSANSVPTSGAISSESEGYVGAGFSTGLQTAFVDRINGASFLGTLGLDSPNPATVQNFNEGLNLSTLVNFRGLGSSSAAILNGPLTISTAQNYLFGGGGGRLTIGSNLTNSSSQLILDSPQSDSNQPLTVVLRGSSTFTGGIQARHGALVFDGPTAIPATGTIGFNQDDYFGYLGFTEAVGLTPNQFLTRLDSSTFIGPETTNIVGVDSTNPASPRTVSDSIDLSRGGTITTPYFLGSASKVILSGAIQPAGNQLALTGVNGGHLVVTAPFLPAVNSLIIGAGSGSGTVEVSAPSSFGGGTTVTNGVLLVGNSQALGSGPVTVSNGTLASSANISLRNTIIGVNDALPIGLPGLTPNLTLLGPVAASNLVYQGGGQLKIGGIYSIGSMQVNATGSGGVLIASSSFFDYDYYDYYGYYYGGFTGIPFYATINSGYLAFSVPQAAVYDLDGSSGSQVIVHPGSNLTVFGYDNNNYPGTISGGGSLTFTGEGVSLSGNNTYSGGSTLNGGGTVTVGSNTSLGTGPILVTRLGGALTAGVNNVTLSNPISLQVLAEDAYYEGALGVIGDLQLNLAGVISGPGGIYKLDPGILRLSGNNTFSGGILIEDGTIEFTHNNAAGTGPIIFDTFTTTAKAVFTTSAPVIHGLDNRNGIAATVELAANSNLTISQNVYSEFLGSINGVGANNARLTKTGFGGLLLAGTNNYSGGTFVTGGGIIFAGTTAIPATGSFVLSANGYVGFGGANTPTDINNFVSKFDAANTVGTIGFDTNTPSNPYLVTTPLSLTGFNFNARLGSASHAIISSTITPQGSSYRFGGGGGLLQVASALIDQITPVPLTRSVIVDSPATTPLTLRLTSLGSTYSGGVNVTNSALVFGPNATLPATGAFTLGTGGYIGWEDTSINTSNVAMSNYVARFATTSGIIGFDTAPGASSTRVISSAIDLTNSGNAYLGTTSGSSDVPGVRLTGAITPSGSTYRFAGYKGGSLEVASILSGSRSVVIGDPSVLATLVDPNRSVLSPLDPIYSTVILTGANTHTGNTTLYGGLLLLGGAQALGVSTNSLIVQSTTIPQGFVGEGLWRPQLGTSSVSNPTFANPIVLNSSLGLGGTHNFTLSGIISGTGGLFFEGGGDHSVQLTGNNTFTGGLSVANGVVNLGSATAMGTGALTLNDSGEVVFSVSSAISGLIADAFESRINLGNGVTLTVNQNTNTTFNGEFVANGVLGGRLVKTGTGTLRVEGYSFGLAGIDTAGTRISVDVQQGTLVLGGSGGELGSSASVVRVSGGTLALDNSLLYNNVQAVSGRLAGTGTFAGTASAIGANVVLAPGLATAGAGPIGRLSFENLNLVGGGVLEWNIQSLAGGGLATDAVGVLAPNGLMISSSAGNPFTVKVISLLPNGALGALSGLTAGESYSWVLFETNGIVGFDPSKFTIDASQFNAGISGGFLSLSLSTTPLLFTQTVMLNFSPVPEPSTWALMIGGVGALAFTLRRRSRRRFE